VAPSRGAGLLGDPVHDALIHELVAGDDLARSAARLLLVGNAVWFSNNIAFGLLYWEVDSGGSVVRGSAPPPHPDLAFPQHLTPEIAPPGWRPIFVDYLYLGFTNALAFSPTDVMPLVPWAKIAEYRCPVDDYRLRLPAARFSLTGQEHHRPGARRIGDDRLWGCCPGTEVSL
jgi:hypothetical protein